MFERFTDRARKTTVLAQEEARALHHDYIGTEHLVLGILKEGEGLAARSLDSLGITHAVVKSRVVAIIGKGDPDNSWSRTPFTPRAKKVLEGSLRESLQLGHNYINTEHILLSLIREGEGVAARILEDRVGEPGLGLIRKRIIVMLSDQGEINVEKRPLQWTFEVPEADPEVQVMSVMLDALTNYGSLTSEAQKRVIRWLSARLGEWDEPF
jgi:ATP-dependent Clp protease ATP-binding subunit ClpC